MGFPGGSDGKESVCNTGDPSLICGLGRSPGERNGYPLRYFCLENSMDRGAWQATVRGVANSQTCLSDYNTFTLVPSSCLLHTYGNYLNKFPLFWNFPPTLLLLSFRNKRPSFLIHLQVSPSWGPGEPAGGTLNSRAVSNVASLVGWCSGLGVGDGVAPSLISRLLCTQGLR